MTAQQRLNQLTRTDLLGTWGVWLLVIVGAITLGYFGVKALSGSAQ